MLGVAVPSAWPTPPGDPAGSPAPRVAEGDTLEASGPPGECPQCGNKTLVGSTVMRVDEASRTRRGTVVQRATLLGIGFNCTSCGFALSQDHEIDTDAAEEEPTEPQ